MLLPPAPPLAILDMGMDTVGSSAVAPYGAAPVAPVAPVPAVPAAAVVPAAADYYALAASSALSYPGYGYGYGYPYYGAYSGVYPYKK
ncbi:hypothetical protein TNCV_3746931 [Trichonephila clavipes]|nr:hypothetical protein TNCV_3746931 [Trichonephila clavipes]